MPIDLPPDGDDMFEFAEWLRGRVHGVGTADPDVAADWGNHREKAEWTRPSRPISDHNPSI